MNKTLLTALTLVLMAGPVTAQQKPTPAPRTTPVPPTPVPEQPKTYPMPPKTGADEPKPNPAPRLAMPPPAPAPAVVSPFVPLAPGVVPAPVSQEPVPPFTTADYVHRAMLSGDSNFSGRVMVALLDVTDAILHEPPSSAEYETRLKFVATVMREPDFAARRMTRLVASNLPNVQVDSLGRAFTTATDKEIYDYVMSLWTPLAKSRAAFP